MEYFTNTRLMILLMEEGSLLGSGRWTNEGVESLVARQALLTNDRAEMSVNPQIEMIKRPVIPHNRMTLP